MNEQKISPEELKLTAYALGELEGAERAEVERALRDDPAARVTVNEIRALAGQLESVLATEPMMEASRVNGSGVGGGVVYGTEFGLAKEGRSAKASDGAQTSARGRAETEEDPYRKKVVRFPYVWIGGLAAACFAVMVAMRQDGPAGLAEAQSPAQKNAQGEQPNVDKGAKPAAPMVAGAEGTGGEPARAEKARGTLSVAGNAPAATEQPGFLLVKDAEEFAALPAAVRATEPSTVVATEVPAEAAIAPAVIAVQAPPLVEFKSADTTAEVSVFSAPPEPIKVAEVATGSQPSYAVVTKQQLATPAGEEDTIALSPFSVTSSDRGYASSRTVSGSRRGKEVATREKREARTPTGGLAFNFREEMTGPRMNFRAKSTVPFVHEANDAEAYAFLPESAFARVRSTPLSTFSVDVDTASYANVRRFLDQGQRPPVDAVRIEEMVNYFNYRYAPPTRDVSEPFSASMEVASAPWNPAHRLVRIGLKGREVSEATRPAANLVFLLDVSGSMDGPNRLPLVKESLRLLVEKLRADDRVAIVTYAGSSGLALPSTPASKKREILASLDALRPEGSTNGAMGIQLAYDIAKANFIADGANRVILCTDGDFNVGVTSEGELTRLIQEKAKSGVFLTVLGFGMGNYKDATLERLADKGNGNYGYIDSRAEAQKLLVEQAGGTLVTIAKDVKLQVEFNPEVAQAYRLIGYENRTLNKEDFKNDKVDAGEIGAGHTVTALYEIVPVGVASSATTAATADEPLKYQPEKTVAAENATEAASGAGAGASKELFTLKIRFKEPKVDVSQKLEIAMIDTGAVFEAASKDFKFAAAVASLGMILRESQNRGTADYNQVITWAEAGRGDDADGRRGEFIELVKKARAMSAE